MVGHEHVRHRADVAVVQVGVPQRGERRAGERVDVEVEHAVGVDELRQEDAEPHRRGELLDDGQPADALVRDLVRRERRAEAHDQRADPAQRVAREPGTVEVVDADRLLARGGEHRAQHHRAVHVVGALDGAGDVQDAHLPRGRRGGSGRRAAAARARPGRRPRARGARAHSPRRAAAGRSRGGCRRPPASAARRARWGRRAGAGPPGARARTPTMRRPRRASPRTSGCSWRGRTSPARARRPRGRAGRPRPVADAPVAQVVLGEERRLRDGVDAAHVHDGPNASPAGGPAGRSPRRCPARRASSAATRRAGARGTAARRPTRGGRGCRAGAPRTRRSSSRTRRPPSGGRAGRACRGRPRAARARRTSAR